MQLDIKAKNLELTPTIRAMVEEAMEALAPKVARFGESVSAEVEVGMTTRHHKKGSIFRAEIHVRLPDLLVYAENEDFELFVAFTAAKKEALRQIMDYKGIKRNKSKKDGRKRA